MRAKMTAPERSGAAEIQGEETKRHTPAGDIGVCRLLEGRETRLGGSYGGKRAWLD